MANRVLPRRRTTSEGPTALRETPLGYVVEATIPVAALPLAGDTPGFARALAAVKFPPASRDPFNAEPTENASHLRRPNP